MNISVALQITKAASELDVQTSESPIFIKVFIFEFGSRSWLVFGCLVENEELFSSFPFTLRSRDSDDIL